VEVKRCDGHPGSESSPSRTSTEIRFWSKIQKQGNCWLWTAASVRGYGRFFYEGKVWVAHRWAYEHFVGPVPDGLDLDHLCRNRGCVNPAHLEPVTRRENLRRGHDSRPCCPQGHPRTPENTYERKDRPGSHCRVCHREKKNEARRKQRQEHGHRLY